MIKKLLILLLLVPIIQAMEQPQKKELSPIRSIFYLTRNKKWDKDSKKNFLYWYAALKIDEAKNLKELDDLHKYLLALEIECIFQYQRKETTDLPLNLYPFFESLTSDGHKYLMALGKIEKKSGVDKIFESKVHEILSHIHGQISGVELLYDMIKKGINATDDKSNTALHYVSRDGFVDLVELLISNGADVNQLNDYGQTPLHHANAGVVSLLLEAGADINAQDNKKQTPLHLALCNKDFDKASYLISRGAKKDIEDESNITAEYIIGTYME